jgi:hypothetical protein
LIRREPHDKKGRLFMIGSGGLGRRWSGHLTRTPKLAYVLAIVAPALLVLATLSTGVDPWIVLRDPIAAMGGSTAQLYYGMLSNVGVIVWAAAAAICLFVAATDGARLSSEGRRFLLFAGILTSILTIDDLFMVHENADSALVYLPYGLAAAFYLYRFGNLILSLDPALIIAAVAFMGMSVATDLMIELREQWHSSSRSDVGGGRDRPERSPSLGVGFLEDVFKFLGICCWSVFHIRAAGLLRSIPELGRSWSR